MAFPFRTALAAAATLLLLTAVPSWACSVCGCGDPLLASSDPAAINGGLRLELDTEYLRVDAGTDGQPGYTDQLTQWSYRLNAVYRPIEPLSLSLTVPLVSKAIRTVGGGTSVSDSSLTGLGDLEIGARYALWTSITIGARRVQEFAISAGSALPTGNHSARDSQGNLVDPHGQLGTGGWGPFAGIHYRFEQGDWMGFASLSYRLRTEATYFDESKYKFGDAALWSVHGQYRPTSKLALDLGVDGRYAVADRAVDPDGTVTARVENTGGTLLSLSPGVYFNALGKAWFFVRSQVPIYKHLFGEQDVRPSFTAGFQYQIF
ncbi:MAG TPA: TonB-dependent receptor [Anaeromyxobacter sp.]|nr:TonB-dependent receptor [Anaeromyxobacter sp.]